MTLASSSAFISLAVAPTADTQEPPAITATLERPPSMLAERLISSEPVLLKHSDPWDQFQNEFGRDQEKAPSVLDSLAHAKYGVDLTVYTVTTFLDRLEDILELRYTNGRIESAAANPQPSAGTVKHGPVTLEDARLKFDFAFAGGQPYVGVRLVLPFGN
ncbi:MAG: hypothetical protein WCS70_15360 [Verrucomicrobiota bacterium]